MDGDPPPTPLLQPLEEQPPFLNSSSSSLMLSSRLVLGGGGGPSLSVKKGGGGGPTKPALVPRRTAKFTAKAQKGSVLRRGKPSNASAAGLGAAANTTAATTARTISAASHHGTGPRRAPTLKLPLNQVPTSPGGNGLPPPPIALVTSGSVATVQLELSPERVRKSVPDFTGVDESDEGVQVTFMESLRMPEEKVSRVVQV